MKGDKEMFKNGDIVRIKEGYLDSKKEGNYRYAVVNVNEDTNRYMISCLNSGLSLGSVELVDGDMITNSHIYYDYENEEVLTDWDLTIIYEDLKAMGDVEDETAEDYISNCTTGNGQLDTYTNINQYYDFLTR